MTKFDSGRYALVFGIRLWWFVQFFLFALILLTTLTFVITTKFLNALILLHKLESPSFICYTNILQKPTANALITHRKRGKH